MKAKGGLERTNKAAEAGLKMVNELTKENISYSRGVTGSK
jgi:hypothetical protein